MAELPTFAERDVIQVVMTEAFYRAHFQPLLRQQDFGLVKVAGTDEEDEAGLPTYVIVLGESRARLLHS